MFNEFDLKSLSLKELDQLIFAANEEKNARKDERFKTLTSEVVELLNTIKKEYPWVEYNVYFDDDDALAGYTDLFNSVEHFSADDFYK